MAAKGSQSFKYLYPEWQPGYEAAIVENDPAKIGERFRTAEQAMLARLRAIPIDSTCEAERQAIENALGALQILKSSCGPLLSLG